MGTIIVIIVICVILILLGLYAYKSVITINTDEIGVLIRFGQVTETLNAGLHFCPWLFLYTDVIKYSRAPVMIKIKVLSAITNNGLVKNYKEDGREIERTEMNFYVTLKTYYSENLDDLKKTVANAPRSSMGHDLGTFVISVIRAAASEMPWPLINNNWNKVSKYIMAGIIPNYEYYDIVVEDEADEKKPNKYSFSSVTTRSAGVDVMECSNPFVQFGLDLSRTSLEIQNIDFSSPKMKEIFDSPEVARIEGDASVVKAKADAEKTKIGGKAEAEVSIEKNIAEAENKKRLGLAEAEVIKEQGKAKAEARRLMIEQIKNNTDLEYLRTLEEMAKGTANTIIYQMPKAFENRVTNMLGGNKAEDLFSLFKDPEVMTTIKETIEKLTKTKE